jgi:hypothetical protein
MKWNLILIATGSILISSCLKTSRPSPASVEDETRLISHYEKTLGAVHVGGHRMVIYPQAALKLINQYFNPKK